MNRFIKNCIIFAILFIGVILSLKLLVNWNLNQDKYFLVDKKVSSLILGHSHGENALNDSIITNLKNFSQSGESYFYTYYKLKKIVQVNKNIKNVFLIYSNNQIGIQADFRVWGHKYLNHTFPKYAAFINFSGLKVLFSHGWEGLMSSECLALKQNLSFCFNLQPNKSYFKYVDWGAFAKVEGKLCDNYLLKQKRYELDNRDTVGLSEVNIDYFLKSVRLLSENKINLYLIRCPLHHSYQTRNDKVFQQLLFENNLSERFLDFKDFPLNDDQFLDKEHLNTVGSTQFSILFNSLINDSFLNLNNKQLVIDSLIRKIRDEKNLTSIK